MCSRLAAKTSSIWWANRSYLGAKNDLGEAMRDEPSIFGAEFSRINNVTLMRATELFQIGRHLGRSFRGGAGHFVEDAFEIFQTSCRDDDGVAPAINVFGDPEKTAARIFLQSENESLAFDLNFVAAQRVFNNALFWRP
jgi:hypothetical protein